MKTFVFLDTNIFFRFVTQGRTGCQPEYWEQLKASIEDSSVSLLVPEVVALEFEKKIRAIDQTLAGKFDQLKPAFLDLEKYILKIWNEFHDLHACLAEMFETWKQSKLAGVLSRSKEVEQLLTSDFAVLLPFDEEIVFRSKRRMLAGRIKNDKSRAEADCFNIEIIRRFFDESGLDNQLYICTEDAKEYGLEIKGKITLHPLVSEGLPPCELFPDLASLIEAVKAHRTIETPSREAVEAAVLRDAIRSEAQPPREPLDEKIIEDLLNIYLFVEEASLPTVVDIQSNWKFQDGRIVAFSFDCPNCGQVLVSEKKSIGPMDITGSLCLRCPRCDWNAYSFRSFDAELRSLRQGIYHKLHRRGLI